MSEVTKETTETKEKQPSKAELLAENEAMRAELEAIRATKAPAPVIDGKDPMRPVTLELPFDGNDYKNDLYVAVNNRTFLIQRGVPVTVPFYVAQAVKESADQDKATARMIAIKEQECLDQIAARGL